MSTDFLFLRKTPPINRLLRLFYSLSGGLVFAAASVQLDGTQLEVGRKATLSVSVEGTAPFTYQWLKDGQVIDGATSDKYLLSEARASDEGGYSVIVSNASGTVTSPSEFITMQAIPTASPSSAGVAPSVSTQPSDQIVTVGHDVALTASNGNTVGQWQYSSDSGISWSNLSNDGRYGGVTTSRLSITGATLAQDGYKYRFVTSTTTGSAFLLNVASGVFPFPVGVATDGTGNLYVSDTSSDTVQKVSSSGSVTLFAGMKGLTGASDGAGSNARFNDPSGIVVGADGSMSVCDSANATIRRISSGANVTTLAGSTTTRGNTDATGSSATFSSPLGICQDTNGNLYVADGLNHTIRKLTAGGVVTTIAGNPGVAGSSDGTGNTARFNHPTGITIDTTGNLYVSDTTNNTIRKIATNGAVTTLAGLAGVSGSQDGGGSGALFNNPGGIASDLAGNIYVADTGNSSVRKISSSGTVSTLAGLPGIAGLMDGTGTNAWFNQPKGLTFDASGVLYVADTGNAAIRRVSLTGVVSTLALAASSIVDSAPAPIAPVPATPAPSPASVSASSSGIASSASTGGGGGGGAMEGWFVFALVMVVFFRVTREFTGRMSMREACIFKAHFP